MRVADRKSSVRLGTVSVASHSNQTTQSRLKYERLLLTQDLNHISYLDSPPERLEYILQVYYATVVARAPKFDTYLSHPRYRDQSSR